MVQAFIQSNGVTICPPKSAAGTGWLKPTALGWSREDTGWLSGKSAAKSNEENLAKAKIYTMLEDVAGKARSTPSERVKLQNEAYRWFFRPSDFEDWCDIAGFDPDFIREKARNVHENGLPQWRAAPGEGKNYDYRKKYRERSKQ